MSKYLSRIAVDKLARKLARHHKGFHVKVSYTVIGNPLWEVSVYNEDVSQHHTVYSYGFYDAKKELQHIAKHGIDFNKKGSQL